METRNREPEVTAGKTIFTLTKEEVRDAVFFFAIGRKPTDSEMKRLVFYVCDDDMGSRKPWSLELILKDHPPTVVAHKDT